MNYTLEHSSIQDCLCIRVIGRWPSRKPERIISDIFNLWKEYKQPVLIDIRRMEDAPGILGDYQNAERFADAGFGRLGRIAVLDNQERRDANDFFETTASNRGLKFRFFYAKEQEAIAWLVPKKEGEV